ncbi:MAG TPA: sugar transferase [Acidimicrobiia bacterium]|nr:sugar transferase [Acidimicrobiia bacterium]
MGAPPRTPRFEGIALATSVLFRAPSVYEKILKPMVDRVAAAVLLLVSVPLMLTIATTVLVRLGRPVFFVQERIGKDGVPFRMVKFRTMRPDRRRSTRHYDGTDRRRTHKSPDDPRHTSLGRFLRRSKLDELPQLLHVLTGRMSLVGPRPELESVVRAKYEGWQHARHVVRPGLSGLWQVTAQHEDEEGRMHDATDIDLRYITAMGPLVDVEILVATLVGRAPSRLSRLASGDARVREHRQIRG